MGEYQFFSVEVEDHVAIVTYDRPPVNATTRESMAELTEVFQSFDTRKDVNAVVLTAAGQRAFVAGADIKQRAQGPRSESVNVRLELDSGKSGRDAFWSIYDCIVPVIGAINGPAIGAGLAIASVCDVLVASENARFGVTEINVGLLGAGSHMQRMVGPYMARYMFYTGELVPAAELQKYGCILEVVPHEELMPKAIAVARKFSVKSPIGLRLAKESLNRVEYLPLKDAYRLEQDYTKRLSTYEDSMEAARAFAEQRLPEWKWR